MSKDLILLMAKIMPEEMILDKMQEAIVQHNILKTKDTKQTIIMYCHLLCSKDVIDEVGIDQVMKDTDELKAIHDRLKTSKS